MSLAGKTAVITGASSGIGYAIACHMASLKINLVLLGRNTSKLEEMRSVYQDRVCVDVFRTDFLEESQIQETAHQIIENIDTIDILVHSAGLYSRGEFTASSMSALDELYLVNLRAPFLLTKLLLPTIKKKEGQIIVINSSCGLKANAGISQYSAVKHGVKAMTDSLRGEVNKDGVRVLSLFLGRTATPMQAFVHKLEKKSYHPANFIQPEDVAEIVISSLNIPHRTEITDIIIRPTMKLS